MPYLIDGHNLIAQLTDIDLNDPQDEAKLVIKLRSIAVRIGKKMTVVFDGGLPGGISKALSTAQIEVKFASSGKMTADHIMLNAINAAQNPQEFTVVTSDEEIASVARARGMIVLTAQAFIASTQPAKPKPREEKQKTNPNLSAAEVEDWLKIFTKFKK